MADTVLDLILTGEIDEWFYDPFEDEEYFEFDDESDFDCEAEFDIDEFFDSIPHMPEIVQEARDIDWNKEGVILSGLCDIKFVELNGLQTPYTVLMETLRGLDLPRKVIFESCAYVAIGDHVFLINPDFLHYGFYVFEVKFDKLPELVYQLLMF